MSEYVQDWCATPKRVQLKWCRSNHVRMLPVTFGKEVFTM